MTLREKLMHYTHDLDCGTDLKQEAIATIEQIAQYMDEDELLNHSRPLALAYLALTEDASAPVVHGRWIIKKDAFGNEYTICSACDCSELHVKAEVLELLDMRNAEYCPNCGAMMDGGAENG